MNVVVNLNDTVRFKLTEHGKEVYRAQFDELNEFLKSKRAPLCPRPEPDIDAEGYTKMQLWNFMEVFGPHTGMGLKPCIEPINIVVDVESYKKEAVMMPQKYIPLEAAITAMTADNLLKHFDSVEDVIENRFHRAAERILASIPAAAVVEVVRCGDCKHYNAGFECLIEGYGIERPADYFCADGERKDGGQDDGN